jgi:hypothetical protein
MARFTKTRRESVWFDTEIRTTPVFNAISAINAISAAAFGLWTRLPFLVDVVVDAQVLPELADIAQDSRLSERDTESLLAELVAAGLVEVELALATAPAPLPIPVPDGQDTTQRSSHGDRHGMTLLSQQLNALSEPEGEGAER